MARSKKRCRMIWAVRILETILLFSFISIMLPVWIPRRVNTTQDSVTTASDAFLYANQLQFEASVWMGAYRQELYFFPHCNYRARRTAYDEWLCVFRDGGVQKLCKLGNGGHVNILGLSKGFLYYWKYADDNREDMLYCYDLEQSKEEALFIGEGDYQHTTFFAQDGSLGIAYFPDDAEDVPEFLWVKDGKLCGTSIQGGEYPLGQYRYAIAANRQDLQERIFVTDVFGEKKEISLGYATRRALFPLENGFLIHNEGGCAILYHIDASNRLKQLFRVSCLASHSAVTVVGDNAFLSLKRYEKFGELGMLRFENDTIEGTYRIDLKDLSMTKISDEIYNGLYFFGGDCLYACDENCSISMLDMQGKELYPLFEVEVGKFL